jgi:ACS family hexuronate transporter-like MFS transporter
MFLVSPVWVFFINWIPGFLQKQHKLDLVNLGGPLIVVYLMADVGSITGGWLSSTLIARGRGAVAARLVAMLVCAVAVIPVCAAAKISSLWWVVLVLGLATAAHQGFSANLYTIVTDTMPRGVASSVVGIGGLAGQIGSALSAVIIGNVLKWTHDYRWLFVWAASSYLVALAILYFLLPRARKENSAT